MKTVILTLLALGLLTVSGAAAVVGFGLYNVSARSGHLPGVSWALHTTYRNSVRLRAPSAQEVPDTLTDPDLIELGARHYETACAFCHAAPGQRQPATAGAMVPRPPHVTDAVSDWQPRHLFWIIREGVKMSGMPHWPAADRDDEIWSVVAYLDAVRREDPALPAISPQIKAPAAYCASCHGDDGRSANRFVPRLDILSPDYFRASMKAYRNGGRESGIMSQAAAMVDEDDLADLADRSAAGTASGLKAAARGAPESKGAELARSGTRDVPACTACHGPGATETSALMPALAGQKQAYIETQLRLWRGGERKGTERSNLMTKAAMNLGDADIKAVAEWYAALRP
ncbi:MAG: c-type cytochrome [Paracoccaceae bacterium]